MIHYFTHREENSIEYFCYTTGCEQGKQKPLLYLDGGRNSPSLGISEKTSLVCVFVVVVLIQIFFFLDFMFH